MDGWALIRPIKISMNREAGSPQTGVYRAEHRRSVSGDALFPLTEIRLASGHQFPRASV